MKTLGSLIDDLQIVNLKMWNAQELLYVIRNMTLTEFKEKYSKEENLESLYLIFKKACDLNVQRANITDEIDDFFSNVLSALEAKTLDYSKLTKKKHKTY